MMKFKECEVENILDDSSPVRFLGRHVLEGEIFLWIWKAMIGQFVELKFCFMFQKWVY